jgi:unsaturated rhamnogalacturonyl hydrolase
MKRLLTIKNLKIWKFENLKMRSGMGVQEFSNFQIFKFPHYFLILLVLLSSYLVSAQKLPARKETLRAMQLANNYFMNKWPDAGKTIFTNIERPSNIWTRSVYYEGLMAMYKVDADKKYYDYALQWAEFHKWNLRGGTKTRNADNQCCGQVYIDLYLLDKKEERIQNIKASIDSMMATQKIDDWTWIDAIQMAMPVYTRLGVVYKDTNYFHRMYEMYAYSKYKHGGNGLFDPKTGLWWRDKDFVYPAYKEPNGEGCYWARGDGWVVAALVRVLQLLPKSDPHYKEYLDDYKTLCKSLLPLQREDGFWNVSLKDPDHFGGKELTGTSLFVYGFAWGVNNGILDKKQYGPAIAKAWNSLLKDCVHPEGALGYVQSTGKEPKEGQPVTYDKIPDFEDFGLGCFLLAGSEVYKYR